MIGYFKNCNMCGGAFAAEVGAREYIRHLQELHCGNYYGHRWSARDRLRVLGSTPQVGLTCDPIWLWYTTAQEREYLRQRGHPIEHEMPWRPR